MAPHKTFKLSHPEVFCQCFIQCFAGSELTPDKCYRGGEADEVFADTLT